MASSRSRSGQELRSFGVSVLDSEFGIGFWVFSFERRGTVGGGLCIQRLFGYGVASDFGSDCTDKDLPVLPRHRDNGLFIARIDFLVADWRN